MRGHGTQPNGRQSGSLLRKEHGNARGEICTPPAVSTGCRSDGLYHEYQEFGDQVFPRLVRCFDDAKPTLELRVVELNVAGSLDAELFARPDGARETVNRPDFAKPPSLVYQTDPAFPSGKEPPKVPSCCESRWDRMEDRVKSSWRSRSTKPLTVPRQMRCGARSLNQAPVGARPLRLRLRWKSPLVDRDSRP